LIGSGQLSPSRLATAHYNRGLAYQGFIGQGLAIRGHRARAELERLGRDR
jgi:hypothetical protein